jgi:hypothetical protein
MRRVETVINGRKGYIMAQAGRKRKTDVERYPGGRIAKADRGDTGETVEQIKSTVVAQRVKMWGASLENASDQQWACPLGQWRMQAKQARDDSQGLSAVQYEAIKRYVTVRHLNRVAQGYGTEHPKSISGEMVSGSGGIGFEYDDDEVFRRMRDYNGARSALLEYAGRGVEYVRVVEGLARDETQHPHKLGTAREAANILVRYFGM